MLYIRVFILYILLGWIVLYPGRVFAARVCDVHDGDTLTLCTGTKIRLWGIDAPELRQPMGEQSRDFLAALVLQNNVGIVCDDVSFDRLVCNVYVGDHHINEMMVFSGWAYDYPKYSGHRFSNAEQSASLLLQGVWILPEGGVKPWRFRHR